MRARVAPVGRSNRRDAVGRAAGWESWIDLYGDLAGILTLAGKKDRPLDQNDLSVQHVKMVAGARNDLYRTRGRLPRAGS